MLTDIAIVLGFAAVAVAIVFFLFNSVSDVPKAKMDASQVLASAVAPKAKSAPKKSKKDAAAEKAKEKELEELIAREATGNKGMATERYEVTTLEAAKQKAKAKKDANKNSGAAALADKKPVLTEEAKAKDRAHGFKIVETKEDKKEAPIAASVASASKGHSGTRRASPASPAASKRDELENKLSQFFKGTSRRRRDGDDYEPKKAADNTTSRAERKVAAPRSSNSPASANAWAEDREW